MCHFVQGTQRLRRTDFIEKLHIWPGFQDYHFWKQLPIAITSFLGSHCTLGFGIFFGAINFHTRVSVNRSYLANMVATFIPPFGCKLLCNQTLSAV